MAISKLVLASIAIALVIIGVRSDAEIVKPEASESSLRSEIEELRSKISALESNTEDRIREIKAKEDIIGQLNSVIQEKLLKTAALESEVELLQGVLEANNLDGKADARVEELKNEITKLRTEIEVQSKKKDALATRASEAEKKVQELNLRLESLQATNEEQKLRIRKTQRALELAEEELMKAQLEATSKLKDLNKVHGAWLPPWLAEHIYNTQNLAAAHWNELAKPTLILILHKASEMFEQVQKWAEPHFTSAKTEWIPAAKEQLITLKSNAKPYVQKLSTKTFELYEASMRTSAPHIAKSQKVAYAYFQGAREFMEPYIDQIVVVSKPHVERLQLSVKPYTKHVTRAYRKFLRRARTYHHQVQENIYDKLKRHELTKPHATKELAWFVASALLAFPIFFLYRVLTAVFCKKTKKPRMTTRSNHAHRRPKRRHADK